MNEQEVAVKLTEVEARCKSNTHRLDNVEKRQNALDTDIKEIKADVKTITQKPSNGGTGSLTSTVAVVRPALNLNLNQIKFSIVS